MKIPPAYLAAYRAMIAAGQIKKHHVLYNRSAGTTTVEYYSAVPHDWIRQEMKRLIEEAADSE